MTQTVYTDRSRIESYQRCNRLRWLEYHQDGGGITSAQKPLPLAVGSAVHVGLATLLEAMMDPLLVEDFLGGSAAARMAKWEQIAVENAVAELAKFKGALALDPTEAMAQASAVAIPDDLMRQQLAESLGLSVSDAGLDSLITTQTSGAKGFEDYLWREQSGLVEGMVRAYARRRLRPLLAEFEVLEVEREGTWTLAEAVKLNEDPSVWSDEIVFCSRPDALLRSRSDNSLYLMSFKTAATWDRRKELDAQHDAQGLSEGVEVERRLGEYWKLINDQPHQAGYLRDISQPMFNYLAALPAPPRILGIRYEYLLKGYRGEDKDLSARFGFKCYSQRSHLVRRYRAVSLPKKGEGGFSLGDYCWSFEYLRDDGSESKLYYGHWKSEPVDNVKAWIDRLDQSEEAMSAYDSTVGQEPRPMGWKSAGQALGYTQQHPLDAIFIPPITVYRNDDDLRDWLEQTEAQEVRVAEAVALIQSQSEVDPEDVGRFRPEQKAVTRSLLNQHFPMTRRACEYPSTCAMVKICYGGEDIQRNPLGSGMYVERTPNHEAEKVAAMERGK